jgi:outer membrane receptor for ferrienterochelin and colicins
MNPTTRSRILTSPYQAAFIVAGIAMVAAPAQAQTTDDNEVRALDPVVVTAAGVETSILNAPASVTVIPGEEIANQSFVDLTDALRNVPGVAIAGSADGENIFIRGLPSEYTLILIDGKRLNSRAARTNASGGVDQYFMPPASAIDRIEIVRGPMSALYGSDAMGGVINIITKSSYANAFTGSLSLEVSTPEDDEDSSENQQSIYLSAPLIRGTLGLQVWARHLDRSPSDRVENGRVVGPDARDIEDLTGRMTIVPHTNHELMLEFSNSDVRTDRETSPDRQTIVENSRTSISLGYDGRLSGWNIDGSIYREDAEQGISTSRTGRRPEISTTIIDATASSDFVWNGIHQLTFGSEWRDDELADQNLGLGSTEQEEFSNSQWAIFAENIWNITPEFSFMTGARLTDDERFGSEITPRLYGVWEASDGIYLNAGIASGYRTPEIRESVESYFSCTGGSCRRAVVPGNPDLQPEQSTSYELGARYGTGTTLITATAFYTDYRDRITTRDTGLQLDDDPRGPDLFEWFNVDEARVRGLELSARQDLGEAVTLTSSYTWNESEFRSGEFKGRPLSRMPDHLASLRAEWDTDLQGLNVWSSIQYTGDSSIIRRDDLVEYESFTTVDFGVVYDFNRHLTLKTAIYNVTDERIEFNENGRLENGRTFWFGLTTGF